MSDAVIKARVQRILADLRSAPAISAAIVSAEYASRHGADERVRQMAAEILHRRFGRLRGLRRVRAAG
jgi:hypothetical protein